MYTANQERKSAKETGKQKLETIRATGDNTIKLTDAEWEQAAASTQNETWKDEYVTVVVTLPFLLIFIGSILLAFTGNEALLSGTVNAIKALSTVNVDVGTMMTVVVYAAVGLKVWRNK